MTQESRGGAGKTMAEFYNKAVDAVFKERDRRKAELFYEAAQDVVYDERDAYQMCWRVMILYQRSVNLLTMHSLGGCGIIPEEKRAEARLILGIWDQVVQLVPKVHAESWELFKQRHGFDARACVSAIEGDALYRATMMRLKDGSLVPALS